MRKERGGSAFSTLITCWTWFWRCGPLRLRTQALPVLLYAAFNELYAFVASSAIDLTYRKRTELLKEDTVPKNRRAETVATCSLAWGWPRQTMLPLVE